MNVFIIGVPHKGGSELLASPYIEKELKLLGISPAVLPVADGTQLAEAVRKAVMLGGLILTPLTGNSSIDKLLSDAVAKACGCPLELNRSVFEQMAEKNVKLTKDEVTKFATLPQGAEVYAVYGDSYPAYQLDGENIHAILLPADKAEQCGVFLNTVFPALAKQPKYPCSSHTLRVMDLSIYEVEKALKDGLSSENPCVAVYPGKDDVVVRVSVRAEDKQQASSVCQNAARSIYEYLGDYVYGVDVPNIETALLQRLEKKQLGLNLNEFGTAHGAQKRLINCKGSNRAALNFPEANIPAIEKAKAEYGLISTQAVSTTAAAISDSKTVGVAIAMPTAKERAASAIVAASFSGHVLTKEIPISNFSNVKQLESACVSQALNLARKFAESHPALPEGAKAALVSGGAAVAAKSRNPVKKEDTAVSSGKAKKKESLPKRIISSIFPQKTDSKKEKMRKLGLILCICVFCGSMAYLLNHRQQGVEAGKENEKFNDLINQVDKGEINLEDFGVTEEDIANVEPEILDKYKPFVAMNSDMVGWISIPDTAVNYPVVQTYDNEYYERKGFDGEYDYYGVPFLDYECRIDIDPERESDNMIVYGHNIGNDGLMFNPVSKYKQLDFYKQHPIVRFDSIYREQQYKIFAVMIVNAEPAQDNGTVFRYNEDIDFIRDEDFNAYVAEIRKRSMWDIDVDVTPDDNLLMISTCCYDFRPGARCVVVARALREGEDPTVDTSTAKVNADAYYPKAYLDALNEKAKYGQVKGISIAGDKEYTLEVGKTLQLKAVTDPADAPINTATWTSSASAIATVDKNGVVTAVSPGEVNITAMADDGGYAASVKITVTTQNVLEYLYFKEEQISLNPGDEYKLNLYAEPKDAALDLNWTSDSEAVVISVNKSNTKEVYIRALENTDVPVTITAQDKNTKLAASIPVYVGGSGNGGGATAQKVTVSAPAVNFTPDMNGQTTITVTVTPPSAASKLEFESSDRNVVRIAGNEADDATGTVILYLTQRGEAGGSAKINIFYNDDVVGSSTITIQTQGTSTPPPQGETTTPPAQGGETPTTPPEGGNGGGSGTTTPPASGPKEDITLVSEYGTINDGDSIVMESDNYFDFDIKGAKNYTISSSNESLIYVDSSGRLHSGINTGEDQNVTVTIKGENGGTNTFTVLVKGEPQYCPTCEAQLPNHERGCPEGEAEEE